MASCYRTVVVPSLCRGGVNNIEEYGSISSLDVILNSFCESNLQSRWAVLVKTQHYAVALYPKARILREDCVINVCPPNVFLPSSVLEGLRLDWALVAARTYLSYYFPNYVLEGSRLD